VALGPRLSRYDAFRSRSHGQGSLVLHWRRDPADDLITYAVAYKNAAQELVGSLSRAAGSPDGRGYAILFLYRHAIELYLKTVLYRAAKLLQLHGRMTEPWLRAHHSLPKLLAAVRPVCSTRSPGNRPG